MDSIGRGPRAVGWQAATDLMALTDSAEARGGVDQTRRPAIGGACAGYTADWIAGHARRFLEPVRMRTDLTDHGWNQIPFTLRQEPLGAAPRRRRHLV